MQHRHMGGRRPHGLHILIKLAMVFLIFGALVSRGGHGSRSAYWEGFRDGAQTAVQSAESGTSNVVVPPIGALDSMGRGMGHGFGGLGVGEFLLMSFCGLALLGFVGFLFTMARHAGRRSRRGSWGGPWHEDDTTKGRVVDEDEIGPEKDPNDYL